MKKRIVKVSEIDTGKEYTLESLYVCLPYQHDFWFAAEHLNDGEHVINNYQEYGNVCIGVKYVEESKLLIEINGDVFKIEDNNDHGYSQMIDLEDGTEWYIAADSETAGKAARDYWKEMADSDPEEFRHIVGDDNLIRWALGRWAGPGSTKTKSMDEWFDLWLDTPEEQWASYDGEEVGARLNKNAQNELDMPHSVVVYRHN